MLAAQGMLPEQTMEPQQRRRSPPSGQQTVTAGQTVTFTVVATGTPPLSYQWKKAARPFWSPPQSSYNHPGRYIIG